MKRSASVVLAGLLLVLGLSGSSGAEEKGKELFEKKCGMCHPLSRALTQNKDREGWAKTVTQMREERHCPVTEAEAKAIVDYLAKIRGLKAK